MIMFEIPSLPRLPSGTSPNCQIADFANTNQIRLQTVRFLDNTILNTVRNNDFHVKMLKNDPLLIT